MSKGTQTRTLRVDDELWASFGRIAADRGMDRAALLRAYMRQEVERSHAAYGDLLDPFEGEGRRGR